MKTSDYAAKEKHHDLIGNVDFKAWCKRQSRNVNYDNIIEAYEKVEYPRRRPVEYADHIGVNVKVIYSRINKYMELAKKYKAERDAKKPN